MGMLARCRICGATGEETDDDICPGVCPPCFDRRMDQATVALAADPRPAMAYHLLREVGLTAEAAADFLRGMGIEIEEVRT
jgi:hypothetical protein